MTAHPNASILARLAEIAKTDPEPWKRLQIEMDVGWIDCTEYIKLLDSNARYRIKPFTVTIGGVELEGPLREVPEDDTKLWLLFDSTTVASMLVLFTRRQLAQIRWLNEGRLFVSKEARDKYQDALVKLANGEIK